MNLKFVMFILSLEVNPVSHSLNLQLLEEEIRVKSGQDEIYMKLKITNNTDGNLLLYNFNGPPDIAFKEESFFCNDHMSARCTIVIYDDFMNAILASIPGVPKEIDYQPLSAEKFQDVVRAEQDNFREALQVIKKQGTMSVSKQGNIKHFKLIPGSYFLRLAYTSGTSNLNMIDQPNIDADELANEAKMFRGCVKSNVIKLTVE